MQPSIPRKVDITALDDMELVQMARQRDGAAFRTIMQRSNGFERPKFRVL
jgi:hypothetical protein